MRRVDVAMSGGVDSSVAASILVDSGLDVRGVTMRLSGQGRSEAEIHAEEVCGFLEIPHRTVVLAGEFDKRVLDPYAESYAEGRTPNPCVTCNEWIKFGALLESVLADGADTMATGHYARIERFGDAYRLMRASDERKDQSYFLYRLPRAARASIVFPLGSWTKTAVRAHAEALHLPVHDAPESQDACFAREVHPWEIVRGRRPDAFEPGNVVTTDGDVVGRHRGVGGFTIGQRRGLGVCATEALYVMEIRHATREIVVGPRTALVRSTIVARDVVWHDTETEGACVFRHRYGGPPVGGRFHIEGDVLQVLANEPVWAVAPGQALVCYKDERVLGGGEIAEAS